MTSSHSVANKKTAFNFDIEAVRQDFPALHQEVQGNPLAYLDNAATTQKPQSVIDALQHYYQSYNSNIHRGVHALSQKSTKAYEQARTKVQQFLNAPTPEEIIFTRGTTEAINLVAHSYGYPNIGEGDEVLITHMEHHSNIVPWQILCGETGAKLRVAAINEDGSLDMESFKEQLTDRTKLVGVVHVSNSLGTINPVKEVINLAHQQEVPVLVDGAQAVPHLNVDVQELDCEFYTFSGHKIFGPTGIGALYAKKELLEEMPPYQGGGDMIKYVSFEKTMYADLPQKFEAGTPHIAGPIGMKAAIDYLQELGMESIEQYEQTLLDYATKEIEAIDGVHILGKADKKASVLSLIFDNIHPHDVGTILEQEGVAIRAGHHCTQPVMQRFGIPATSRASFALYNKKEEVDQLVQAIDKAKKMFG